MPTMTPQQGGGPGVPQPRAPFRPPWVKEAPPALPMPTAAPWMRARENRVSRDEGQPSAVSQELIEARDRLNAVEAAASTKVEPKPAPGRKMSKITIIPSRPAAEPAENGQQVKTVTSTQTPKTKTPEQPKQIPVVKEKTPDPKPRTPAKDKSPEPRQPVAVKAKIPEPPKQSPTVKEKQQDGKQTGAREKKISIDQPKEKKAPTEPVKEKTIPVVIKTEVTKAPPVPPPAPPAPPGPPMPPPPPPVPGMKDKKPLTKLKLDKIESLRSRPRRRPDWGIMMKEIESVRKLKHVECNDRSAPLLATPVKVKEQFMYESEKPNVHNRLLEQIQFGVALKKVKTNDRSRPILDGLRKFRRQMTIEEQTQQETEAVLAEPDELDDIDKVRDDLQSTKQMLALELRNKEAMERENKRLQARLLNLEVELEKERAKRLKEENPQILRVQEEEENRKLKQELSTAQKVAEEMENKYHDTVGQLEMARGDVEDLQRKNQILERRVANYSGRVGDGEHMITKQPSAKKLAKSNSAIAKQAKQPEPEEEESEYEEETETESEEESSEEEDQEALQERRTARELKLLTTKLKSFKDKEELARKERTSLKDQLKKLTLSLKEEKKRYKVLQKEVESMASVLKEDEEEESDAEEEETESESESESESEASEEESEGDLPAQAPAEDRKKNLTNRSKTHENTLSVLKKGNYMLKANVDRLKDDLFKQKEMAISLQEDLNAVLAELG